MAATTLKDVGYLTKFDCTNVNRCNQGLMLLLEQHGLLLFVNGVETKPVEVNKCKFAHLIFF